MARWFALLSTDVDPHFPTLYALTRILSDLLHVAGTSPEYAVRTPVILVLLGTGGGLLWIVLNHRPDARGALLGAIIILTLLLDPHWREHSAEARMYGLMSVLAIAMLAAIDAGRLVLACWMGFALALLHPFGVMPGLAPAVAVLAGWRRGTRRIAGCGLVTGLGVTLLLVGAWLLLKFVLKSSSGFSAAGGAGHIHAVLQGLDPLAAVAAAGLTTALALVARRPGGDDLRTALLFLATLGAAALFLALLALLKPTTPPYPRYVRWANPVLVCMAAICALRLMERGIPGALRWGAVPATLAASVAAVMVARSQDFGPPWGNALREAALYADAMAREDGVVTHDTFEIFDFPPWWRAGFRCFRGGQSVPYLSPGVRARMPCQAGNEVWIPAGARTVFLIREPIAWVGPRRIHLEDFVPAGSIPFGDAAVDVYRRRAD